MCQKKIITQPQRGQNLWDVLRAAPVAVASEPTIQIDDDEAVATETLVDGAKGSDSGRKRRRKRSSSTVKIVAD
jgi:hypothetical protein